MLIKKILLSSIKESIKNAKDRGTKNINSILKKNKSLKTNTLKTIAKTIPYENSIFKRSE